MTRSLPGLGVVPAGQITGIASTPDGRGYWLVGANGGVFTFGDAGFYGNVVTTQMGDAQPVIALRPTPNGQGYFEVEDVGGIYAYGDALYEAKSTFGVTSATSTLISGLVWSGFATVPNASFGWLSGTDGGVFTVPLSQTTSPAFYGSLPGEGMKPFAPIVGIASTPDGGGYWLLGADGGVFTFGDAGYYGSGA